MADLTLNLGSFETTTATIAAATDAGRAFLGAMFGAGAVSVQIAKSNAPDLVRFAEQQGLSI